MRVMRATTKALIAYYVDRLDFRGDVLEIGGHRLAKCAIDLFPAPRFRYHDLNVAKHDIRTRSSPTSPTAGRKSPTNRSIS